MKRFTLLRTSIIGSIIATCISLPALATPRITDTTKSNVSAVFKQLNVPIEAKFKKFTSKIDFDDSKPETSHANIEVDIPSFDLGDPEYNQEVLKKEWFNGAQFPKASFVSTTIKATAGAPAGTQYDIVGKLSIKGKTADVHFPLTVKKENTSLIFDGSFPIKRLTFNIGEGDWTDTSVVADEVTIKFHIVTK